MAFDCQPVAFCFFLPVAYQSDTGIIYSEYMFGINIAELGKLQQVKGAAIGVGSDINQNSRIGPVKFYKACQRRTFDIFYLAQVEQRGAKNRSGASGGDESISIVVS
jgi:hypothetical protein